MKSKTTFSNLISRNFKLIVSLSNPQCSHSHAYYKPPLLVMRHQSKSVALFAITILRPKPLEDKTSLPVFGKKCSTNENKLSATNASRTFVINVVITNGTLLILKIKKWQCVMDVLIVRYSCKS
jgi:hypothetical protein